MMFELILSLEGMRYYGHIPNPLTHDSATVYRYALELSDWPLLNEHFVDPVNELCGTLLDNGDVDYFDASKCKLLKGWLEQQLGYGVDGRLAELYEELHRQACKAIELGTGVVVEL